MSRLQSPHRERHRSEHSGWLRAAVLGANDGLISTSSLLVGVAAAQATPQTILITGIAGLAAGALSMAAGEYVSVSTQADIEAADSAKEARELAEQPDAELLELTRIYTRRGLSEDLARQVAEELHARDALAAHLRDELGIVGHLSARPVQAALASAGAFAVGALAPLLLAGIWRGNGLAVAITVITLVLLPALGGLAGRLGGASMIKGALRMLFWGAAALAVTGLIGRLFGVSTG